MSSDRVPRCCCPCPRRWRPGKVAPWSRTAHSTSPGIQPWTGGRASQCLYRRVLIAVCRWRLNRDSVVLLVANQHPGLTGPQQKLGTTDSETRLLDLESAVLPSRIKTSPKPLPVDRIAQVRRPAPRLARGVFADRDDECVPECPCRCRCRSRPRLCPSIKVRGQVEGAVAVEVAGHDPCPGRLLMLEPATGRSGQCKRRIGEATGAVGRQDGKAVCVLIDDHDIVAAGGW